MNCIVYDGGLQWGAGGSKGTVLVLLFIFIGKQQNRPRASLGPKRWIECRGTLSIFVSSV
ncbi:hypothetical protein [Rossellomorea vietnamensis]|uniref:hypothetical protein n=1 Tax=Rossellomorea vietnamensis TaxID=218284 RepID=UPI001E60A821|nr:hypothetical protein [Rossellomorea vietnamensis]MCC5803886.1 hypothetical protein [Rossellomorea vietnamensis]